MATIAIIALLTAIGVPIYAEVKRRSSVTATESNLRQVYLALEMYRTDNGGQGQMVGTASELGLPPNQEAFYTFFDTPKIVWWRSPGKKAYGPRYYPRDPSDTVNEGSEDFMTRQLARWLAYNKRQENASVMVGDFHHTVGCGPYPQDDCLFTGYAVTLDGALLRKRATGNIHVCEWWEK